jgi:hypothetical protein
MIIDELFEGPQMCPECGGISFSDLILAEKKDACYYKVKASAKVWPSAYASGRLVQCRKKGAGNYGNKSEGVAEGLEESYIIVRTDSEGKKDVFAGNFETYEQAQKELDACLAHPLHTKYKQKFQIKRKGGEQGVAEEWSQKYKSSINCANPKGFSQKAHCAGRNKNEDVAENAVPQLSVPQLATISDEALDQAYGYGRSTPGNTFGWQANLKSAAYAKQMIDQGVTDIEAISDAIHKGWNTTAQAFVQNPDQFDDTAKLAAAGKLEAKLQQRAQLMKQNYAQLPEEEKEKDRVVARALLQAIRGEQQQGVAEVYNAITGALLAYDEHEKTKGVAEGEQQKGADYRDPKEVDYDDEYDAMVARVKKLAGLGPMKTVYDPNKRVYRNMPTAQQPKK